jgi:hypothetical protein
MAHGDAAGHAGLCRDDHVIFDLTVVGDVNHIVELDAIADDGLAQRGTIDAGIGADLDIVANGDATDLRELVPDAVYGDKAEAVGADDGAGVDGGASADGDLVVDGDAWVEQGIGANGDVIADARAGADDRVVANGGAIADGDVGSDGDIGAEGGRGGDDGRGVDAGLGRTPGIEHDERGGEVGAWFWRAQQGAAGIGIVRHGNEAASG